MKIVLEDKDCIEFSQKSVLKNEGTKEYSIYYNCSIGEKEGQGYDFKIIDTNAEALFGKICNVKNATVQRAITEYIASLFKFEMFKEEKQTDCINVKSDMLGILLYINGECFTPDELVKCALEFKNNCGVTCAE